MAAKPPVCDNPEGVSGILAYRNECHFMKIVGDDGNAATAPDIAEPNNDSQGMNNNNTVPYGSQWLNPDQQIPILTPSSGMTFEKGGSVSGPMSGFGEGSGDSQDTSGTPDGGQSNGPTPNSSNGGSDPRTHLNPGQLNSGHNSFQASPISPHQNLINPSSLDGSTQGFFADPSSFTMPNMGDQSGAFALPSGWGDIPGQTGVTPVGEGVLRALMNMGPMDAMDLSSWDPNSN